MYNYRLQVVLLCFILSAFGASGQVKQLEQAEEKISFKEKLDSLKLAGKSTLEKRRTYNFSENLTYGEEKRHTFDLVLAKSNKPTPLVIYIHGGGFTRGEKENAYIHTDTIRKFIKNKISFATINYRLLKHSDNGVRTSLEDCKRFLQYIRHHAASFNIDKNKIACYGPSAGGGVALWLATHDDMAESDSEDPISRESTRLASAVAIGMQATYDLVKWEALFAEYDFNLDSGIYDVQQLLRFYGVDALEEIYTPEMEKYRNDIDMLGLLTADDPPFYVYSSGKALPPDDLNALYHHPYHARAIREVANEKGANYQVFAPGMDIYTGELIGAADYLIQQLKRL